MFLNAHREVIVASMSVCLFVRLDYLDRQFINHVLLNVLLLSMPILQPGYVLVNAQ